MPGILFLLEDYNYFYTKESKVLLQQGGDYHNVLTDLISRKHYQSDGMANAFSAIGYKTNIIIPECNPLQLRWLKENNKKIYYTWLLQKPLRTFRSRILKLHRTSYNTIQFKTLHEQIKELSPDVIYFYSNIFITREQLLKLKKISKKIILQWTCPIWREQPKFPYDTFDLIVTAALQLKEYFNSKKYPVLYLQQAFDDSILQKLQSKPEKFKGDVIFIGSFSLGHHYRFEVLEHLLKNKIDLTIHGQGKENLPEDSLVRNVIKPALTGIDMYNEYRQYKMAIHIHTTGNHDDGIDWNKYAGAKRLFEITGSGTLLLTTEQENVKELFVPGKEVITFSSADDLVQKINMLRNDIAAINTIAKNGMHRTLNDHSFKQRAGELQPYLYS